MIQLRVTHRQGTYLFSYRIDSRKGEKQWSSRFFFALRSIATSCERRRFPHCIVFDRYLRWFIYVYGNKQYDFENAMQCGTRIRKHDVATRLYSSSFSLDIFFLHQYLPKLLVWLSPRTLARWKERSRKNMSPWKKASVCTDIYCRSFYWENNGTVCASNIMKWFGTKNYTRAQVEKFRGLVKFSVTVKIGK